MGFNKAGIDEVLLESGIIDTNQLKEIWEIHRETKKELGEIILENQFASNHDLIHAKAKIMDMEYLDLREHEFLDEKVPFLVPEAIIRRYCLFPVKKDESVLTVAMKDPTDIFAIDDLGLATFLEIRPVFAAGDEINKLIEKYFKPVEQKAKTIENLSGNKNGNGKTENEYSEIEGKSILFKAKIGSMFIKSGVLTEDQLDDALETQKINNGRIGEILVKKKYITKKVLFTFLEKQLGIIHIDLTDIEIPLETVKIVSENIARRHVIIPVEKDNEVLKVAMSDPLNIFSLDDLRLATGLEIVPFLADEEQIRSLLDKHYEKAKDVTKTIDTRKRILEFDKEIAKVKEEIAIEINNEQSELEDSIDINDVENAPIVKMVNIIFNKAVASGASDIHIEPYEDCVVVRYRIDGQLVETMKHNKKILAALVARIKIISGLNIAERRLPQDGRITLKIEGKSFDMRVSVLPIMFGEKIVIRIADKDGFNVSKKHLGLFEDDLEKFDEILSHPHGIVLVTGPTGSGKSTTLYTALKELCQPNVNILTVEDPVECTVRGVNQVQVNVKSGLTFSTALRSFLRQDPDIIMVGEIRDGETAEIATRAAITGHLVLSTLHTNDAASSITRMIDMGIEPFMISSSIVGVIAQRLVRRLCPKCKQAYRPGINEKEVLKIEENSEVNIFMPQGCHECNDTGYKGRIAIYEIMTITREIREMIARNVTSDVLKDVAIKNGMKTLKNNCSRLVREGITSVDEMFRVTFTKNEL